MQQEMIHESKNKAYFDNKKNSILIMEERQKIKNSIQKNRMSVQKERQENVKKIQYDQFRAKENIKLALLSN